ncbi:hypothetical protein BT69DRAFT_1350823 [Atractiella rhizophila]|nr:hypothetical protein BT69DRAFT_1350823 [Atractiella rhizophila]
MTLLSRRKRPNKSISSPVPVALTAQGVPHTPYSPETTTDASSISKILNISGWAKGAGLGKKKSLRSLISEPQPQRGERPPLPFPSIPTSATLHIVASSDSQSSISSTPSAVTSEACSVRFRSKLDQIWDSNSSIATTATSSVYAGLANTAACELKATSQRSIYTGIEKSNDISTPSPATPIIRSNPGADFRSSLCISPTSASLSSLADDGADEPRYSEDESLSFGYEDDVELSKASKAFRVAVGLVQTSACDEVEDCTIDPMHSRTLHHELTRFPTGEDENNHISSPATPVITVRPSFGLVHAEKEDPNAAHPTPPINLVVHRASEYLDSGPSPPFKKEWEETAQMKVSWSDVRLPSMIFGEETDMAQAVLDQLNSMELACSSEKKISPSPNSSANTANVGLGLIHIADTGRRSSALSSLDSFPSPPIRSSSIKAIERFSEKFPLAPSPINDISGYNTFVTSTTGTPCPSPATLEFGLQAQHIFSPRLPSPTLQYPSTPARKRRTHYLEVPEVYVVPPTPETQTLCSRYSAESPIRWDKRGSVDSISSCAEGNVWSGVLSLDDCEGDKENAICQRWSMESHSSLPYNTKGDECWTLAEESDLSMVRVLEDEDWRGSSFDAIGVAM